MTSAGEWELRNTKQSFPVCAPGTAHFFCNFIWVDLPACGLANIKFSLQVGFLLFVETVGLFCFL